jgi:hypothetical protein
MAAQTQGVAWRLTDAYGRTVFSTTGVSSIVSVTVYATAKKIGGVNVGNLAVGLFKSGVGQAAGSEYALDTVHLERAHTYLVNPWTGVAWTPAELASTSTIQLAIDLETDSASDQKPIRCTQVYGVIEWRPVVRKVTIPVGQKMIIPSGKQLKVS